MKFPFRLALAVCLCLCLGAPALAVEDDTLADPPEVITDTLTAETEGSNITVNITMPAPTPEPSPSVEPVPLEDEPVLTPAPVSYSTYALDDTDGNANSFSSAVQALFGRYEPRTRTVTENLPDGSSVTYQEYVPGVAGMDFNWLAGVALFAMVLTSFFKLVGVILKHG